MKTQQIDPLLDQYLDGSISESDFLILEAALTEDNILRRRFYERVELDYLLEELSLKGDTLDKSHSHGLENVPPSRVGNRAQGEYPFDSGAIKRFVPVTPKRANRQAIGSVIAIAASLLALLSLLSWFGRPDGKNSLLGRSDQPQSEVEQWYVGPSQESSENENSAVGFAVLVAQSNAVWALNTSLQAGSLVSGEPMELLAGAAHFELFSGVQVVVEGQARFQFVSPMEMQLESGKLRANVPQPAQGFVVTTRDAQVVDLGTEFALEVAGDTSSLHVLNGEVELHDSENQIVRLKQGSGEQWTTANTRQRIQASPDAFLSVQGFQARLSESRLNRRSDWLALGESLRRDPSVVLLYRSGEQDNNDSETDSRVLRNLVSNPNATASAERPIPIATDGAIVAATRQTDRWGAATGAIGFSPAGSRLRLHVPGELGSMTFLCWVKINSLDRWYNSLFLTDGHEQYEPHWQIMEDGRMFFSVKKRDVFDRSKGESDKHIFYSPPFWDPSLSGQWLMLTTVYDIENEQVTHSINGAMISQETIPREYLVDRTRIGAASIGNWGLPEKGEPRFAIRNLNGSMDEFILFARALNSGEIASIYEIGRP